MNDLIYLSVAAETARAAGRVLETMYATEVVVNLKGGNDLDLVTAADLAADQLIRERLADAFPEHAVVTEETSLPETTIDPDVPTWIIDPLDGTSNFARGLPLFSVSIALRDAQGARAGVVYDPLRDHLFAARPGGGATLNGRPLQARREPSLRRCIVACDWARPPQLRAASARVFTEFITLAHVARSLGSAALAFSYVAAGWLDVYYNLNLYPWDVAAGELIVREAGGRVTELDGGPWTIASPRALVSNGPVHEAAVAVLNRQLKVEL
ncbi:MAG TPA: inositol monophosphatase family protein [Ardenticatenaceae bacterium]|nr:inositol monophosphatase family protein [Ardenticatenaceae bacterium]